MSAIPPPPTDAPRPPLPRSVWVLSAVSFLADVSGEMIYPLLPLFLVGVLGASKVHLGLVEGAAVLFVSLLSVWAGLRSDVRHRRVPWIRWGYALPVLGKAIMAVAAAWPLVMAGRWLDRVGKGMRGAPRDALIADMVDHRQHGEAFGLHRAIDTAGAVVGIVFAALLLWWLGERSDLPAGEPPPAWLFRVVIGIGAAMGLTALLLTYFIHEADGWGVPPANGIAHDDGTSASSAAPASDAVSTGLRGLPRAYWAVLTVLVLFALANSSDTFLLLRASELGMAPWTVVLVYAACNLTYASFSYPIGTWSDATGRWRLIAVGWLVYAVVYAGFAKLGEGDAWAIWPMMATYGLHLALTEGVGKALIADVAPPAKRGTAMGLFLAATGIATLLASLLGGWLWDTYGPSATFGFGATAAIAGLLALAGVGLWSRGSATVGREAANEER